MLRDLVRRVYYTVAPFFPPLRILKERYEPRRYKYLLTFIREKKCRTIMEIGTWGGGRAFQMIEEAKKYHNAKDVAYYGFDLFEMFDEETMRTEISKRPPAMATVREFLEGTGATIRLYQGNTKVTLPKVLPELPKMDLILIDGGHSIETISNDWTYARKLMHDHTLVIFDDYWNRDDAGAKPVIERIDLEKYDVQVLPIQDRFKKEWGTLTINFVSVRRKP